jgi:MFS family permease
MLVALVFFLLGAIVASVSNNFQCMLIGRSLQGVGGGGVVALSEIIVTDIVPLRLRGQYFGIIGSMISVGAVTGPLLGGGFSEKVNWVRLLPHLFTNIY